MRFFLLGMILIYWKTIPKSKRKKCIFRESCSNLVFRITCEEGFYQGAKALLFRFRNYKSNIEIFTNPITNQLQMILPNNKIIDEEEIAEKIILQCNSNPNLKHWLKKSAS
ncbi:membrane protein insertion efficiency factor YidD [Flagellimonas sp. DF-77]|uniref:membrane protein insertion efficiency factor YidD n=1 Tax=Flagellimonas algarum TaxID=3230298 RepID=UPI00339AD4E8